MKKIFLIILCLCILSAIQVSAKECWECPRDNPCTYSYPAGDGCNSCSGNTYCENDRWYTDGLGWCTTLGCINTFEIKDPFHGGAIK